MRIEAERPFKTRTADLTATYKSVALQGRDGAAVFRDDIKAQRLSTANCRTRRNWLHQCRFLL